MVNYGVILPGLKFPGTLGKSRSLKALKGTHIDPLNEPLKEPVYIP